MGSLLQEAGMATTDEFFHEAEPFFKRYEQGDYAGALKLAEGLAVKHPGQAVHTIFWKVCLNTRLGRIDEALDLMAKGLGEGYWWSERELRSDPDLEQLQGRQEFEKLMAVNKSLRSKAQAGSQPDLQVHVPDAGFSAPYPLLFALHGRGFTSENDDSPYWKQACSLGWLVALPRSSQFSWQGAHGWDDVELARAEILTHYEMLSSRYSLDLSRMVMAGFSQGAALAIHLTLSRIMPARGFFAVAPGGSVMDGLDALLHSARESGVRGYIVAGGKDLRHESFVKLTALLKENNIPCVLEDHPEIGHEFTADFTASLEKGLRFLFP
jgi:predicted esterase